MAWAEEERRRMDMAAIAASVISGLSLAAITGLAGFMSRQMGEIREEWAAMRTAQRNALKASIVQSYETAQRDGYISACELETMNRRAESYYALGGNNYIHAIMAHANSDLEVRGEIPR